MEVKHSVFHFLSFYFVPCAKTRHVTRKTLQTLSIRLFSFLFSLDFVILYIYIYGIPPPPPKHIFLLILQKETSNIGMSNFAKHVS
jgi:hypothetical protein